MAIYNNLNPNDINLDIINKREELKKKIAQNLQTLEDNEELLAENEENEQKHDNQAWNRNYDGLATKTKTANFIHFLCEMDLEYYLKKITTQHQETA